MDSGLYIVFAESFCIRGSFLGLIFGSFRSRLSVRCANPRISEEVMSTNSRRPHSQQTGMNESATLAGIWPEIEAGLRKVYIDKTTMSRTEYMKLYTYPFVCFVSMYLLLA